MFRAWISFPEKCYFSFHTNGYQRDYDGQCSVMNNYFDNHSQYSGSSGKDQIHWCSKETSNLILERAGKE